MYRKHTAMNSSTGPSYHIKELISGYDSSDWIVRPNEALTLKDPRIPDKIKDVFRMIDQIGNPVGVKKLADATFTSIRKHFFLTYELDKPNNDNQFGQLMDIPKTLILGMHVLNYDYYIEAILNAIHVPGLRGNPARVYQVSGTGPMYPGTFEKYSASVLYEMQTRGSIAKLNSVFSDLVALGLTWTVDARSVTETEFELRVGRLPLRDSTTDGDLVSIADVGFGVSQALPIVVALHAARQGQLVYIEQPEIHLHPRAQTAMAGVFAKAIERGVKVVVETHSELLLLAIRTLVAEGGLPPGLVKFHWFERDPAGVTKITPTDLDENGSTAAWPEDFAEVQLDAQARYLDAPVTRAKGR